MIVLVLQSNAFAPISRRPRADRRPRRRVFAIGRRFVRRRAGTELALPESQEGSTMLSRSIGILIGVWLPMLAVTLPIGPVHTANALIAGILATLLSLAALA